MSLCYLRPWSYSLILYACVSLPVTQRHKKINLHSSSIRGTLEMGLIHVTLRLLREPFSVSHPSSLRPYLVFLDNSILMVWRRRIPGNTDTCAVVASNGQHSDRLWRGTWRCRRSNQNK